MSKTGRLNKINKTSPKHIFCCYLFYYLRVCGRRAHSTIDNQFTCTMLIYMHNLQEFNNYTALATAQFDYFSEHHSHGRHAYVKLQMIYCSLQMDDEGFITWHGPFAKRLLDIYEPAEYAPRLMRRLRSDGRSSHY